MRRLRRHPPLAAKEEVQPERRRRPRSVANVSVRASARTARAAFVDRRAPSRYLADTRPFWRAHALRALRHRTDDGSVCGPTHPILHRTHVPRAGGRMVPWRLLPLPANPFSVAQFRVEGTRTHALAITAAACSSNPISRFVLTRARTEGVSVPTPHGATPRSNQHSPAIALNSRLLL